MLPGKAENLRNVNCSCYGMSWKCDPGGGGKSEILSSLAISCFASQQVCSYYI